jgi:pimeloyl-ACP methyl ester carboxylesterase
VRDFDPVLITLLFVIAGMLVRARYWLTPLLPVLLSMALGFKPASAAGSPPLDLKDCRLEHPSGLRSVSARCGYLEVAENPAQPASRKIRLHVAVAPALSKKNALEPLFLLSGGPGAAASQFYAGYSDAFERVRRDRDIVIVDQRGTGRSNPLACEYSQDFESGQLSLEKVRELTLACRAKLSARLEFYTTSIAIRDLDQVREALGLQRIALYGASYGTRVAEQYARRYPARTYAVILDGVVVPELPIGPAIATDAQSTLDRILAVCVRDHACARQFPDLAPRFQRLLESITKIPRAIDLPDPLTGRIQHINVTREHVVAAVRLLSYNSVTIAVLPLLLDEAVKGNLAPLVAQSVMTSRALADQIWIGMHNSVVCAEDVPFYAESHVDRVALARTYIGVQQLDGLLEICKAWPRGTIDPDLHAPLDSRVPALILSGELDPVTPPANGDRVAKDFRDALHIVAAGQGHGQLGTGCVPRLMAEFLNAGTAKGLDASCTKSIVALPFFLNFSGPAP